jgi:hypothetical protein
MAEEIEAALRQWLSKVPPEQPVRIMNDEIDVVVSWRPYVHPHGNTFCTMPAVAYDAQENPIYRALREKSRKLRAAPNGSLRGVLLGDAGCNLLKDIDSAMGFHSHSGKDIIQRYLAESSIDFVAVFVPRHKNLHAQWGPDDPRVWHLYVFQHGEKLLREDFERLKAIQNALPKPNLYGYQARSLHEQGVFDPQGRGQYVPAKWTVGREGFMSAQISARALQELLAGRIDQKQFFDRAIGKTNFFERALGGGQTIKNIRFQSAGNDEDDDYVVFEFDDDPAARRLQRSDKPKAD